MKNASLCVTATDRRRLGSLLASQEGRAWGEPRWLAELEEMLERSHSVESQLAPENLVTMNTRIRLTESGTGKSRTVTLAYPDDLGLIPDAVSIFQPLGTLLLGHKIGDVVECPEHRCGQRLRLAGILYQPEHAGAQHL
jgi:regulator of nucleoside diphosphate kinase